MSFFKNDDISLYSGWGSIYKAKFLINFCGDLRLCLLAIVKHPNNVPKRGHVGKQIASDQICSNLLNYLYLETFLASTLKLTFLGRLIWKKKKSSAEYRSFVCFKPKNKRVQHDKGQKLRNYDKLTLVPDGLAALCAGTYVSVRDCTVYTTDLSSWLGC